MDVRIKCRDAIPRVLHKKRREVSRLYKIGAQSASNFGNPERFAKEKKDAKYSVSTKSARKAPQTLAILKGLPKKKD